MATRDPMNEVEGVMFSAELNLAAGKRAFKRNLWTHPLFGELVELARTVEGREKIVRRVCELASQKIDLNYEHPADVAFSAYLSALAMSGDQGLVAEASSAVAVAPNCCWSIGIAQELLTAAVASGVAYSVSQRGTERPFVPLPTKSNIGIFGEPLQKTLSSKPASDQTLCVASLLAQSSQAGERKNLASPQLPAIEARQVDRMQPRSRSRSRNHQFRQSSRTLAGRHGKYAHA